MHSLFAIALLTISTSADTGRLFRSICETDAMGATRCYTLTYDADVSQKWDKARAHWMHACVLERSQQPRKLSDLFIECQEEFVDKQLAYTEAGATPEQFTTVFQDLAGFAVKCKAEYDAEHRDEIPSQAAYACQFKADWLENRWLTAQAAKR